MSSPSKRRRAAREAIRRGIECERNYFASREANNAEWYRRELARLTKIVTKPVDVLIPAGGEPPTHARYIVALTPEFSPITLDPTAMRTKSDYRVMLEAVEHRMTLEATGFRPVTIAWWSWKICNGGPTRW